jgi:diguanylate cyclase (GGDEF)-like protein
MRAFHWIERTPKAVLLAGMLLLVALLGWTDYLTGIEIAFSVFYFLPVAGAAYFAGFRAGLAVAGASALAWLLADLLGGHLYPSTAVGVWNTTNRLLSFCVLALLLAALRRSYEHERELAHTDPLTGARNRRRFLELVELEIGRAHRFQRVFTVVHLDLDGFKAVNDRMGHGEGDAVLRTIVSTAREMLRKTDVVARLGGDEFAVLLPETDAAGARAAVGKLQRSLSLRMQEHEWPVSCSLGVLTCEDPPGDSDDLMRGVDALTYAAKERGKDTAVFDVVGTLRPDIAGRREPSATRRRS